jgi:ATP-dependent 26S proteasome regulatory subunit
MREAEDVNLAEIATVTGQASGADLKSIAVEAGMNALRRNATIVSKDDFDKGIKKVLGDEIDASEEALRMFS